MLTHTLKMFYLNERLSKWVSESHKIVFVDSRIVLKKFLFLIFWLIQKYLQKVGGVHPCTRKHQRMTVTIGKDVKITIIHCR